MAISVFDIFKIGVGPSSSHTMGPMTASNMFLEYLQTENLTHKIAHIKVTLYGSLAATGIGHSTDLAVIIGLCGFNPQNIDPDDVAQIACKVKQNKQITPPGHPSYVFDPSQDLIFASDKLLPLHTNGMLFEGLDTNGNIICSEVYYSIGGGFVATAAELNNPDVAPISVKNSVPYPFKTAAELMQHATKHGLTVAQIQRANELANMSAEQLEQGLSAIWQVMANCVKRGLANDGFLPSDLKVRRRAKALYQRLEREQKNNISNPLAANDWLSAYAMAVNEENAIGGKLVTAPTNGAAGVIPAVLHYYLQFYQVANNAKIFDFLLTAAAIGSVIKQNASISGAEVGCQGEIGSASSMAAAGFAAVLGGTASQVENAAEIALEHHLGLTCDPVAGLVQVPCIERNAFGAIKAAAAAQLAIYGDGRHFMPLDNCVKTMLQTGLDMDARYKETSAAGLAVNTVNC